MSLFYSCEPFPLCDWNLTWRISPQSRLARSMVSALTIRCDLRQPSIVFAVFMAFLHWVLSDPVLTRVRIVLSLLHQCQIEHLTWASGNLTPNALLMLKMITPLKIALPESCALMTARCSLFAVASKGLDHRLCQHRLLHDCLGLVRHCFLSGDLDVFAQLLRIRQRAMCGLVYTPGNLLVRLNSFTSPQRSVHRPSVSGVLSSSDQSSSTRVFSHGVLDKALCVESVSCTWSLTNTPMSLRGGDFCASFAFYYRCGFPSRCLQSFTFFPHSGPRVVSVLLRRFFRPRAATSCVHLGGSCWSERSQARAVCLQQKCLSDVVIQLFQ